MPKSLRLKSTVCFSPSSLLAPKQKLTRRRTAFSSQVIMHEKPKLQRELCAGERAMESRTYCTKAYGAGAEATVSGEVVSRCRTKVSIWLQSRESHSL